MMGRNEYLGFARTSHGGPSTIVTMLVQIPDNFDSANPIIVAAAPSASRTIYGAVPVVGEWALQHGCAVVYTDKGLGVGFHDLDRNMAFAIDGECVDAEAPDVNYKRKRPGASWQQRYPYRFACKHAHSQRNPEQSWGQDVRRSIRFAFYVLNKHFKSQNNVPSFTRKNTKVIAAGISNGGAAALLAAEADLWDGQDLIDAVVAAEPTIQPSDSIPLTIIDGGEKVGACNRSLIDYLSLMNVYQCAQMLIPRLGRRGSAR